MNLRPLVLSWLIGSFLLLLPLASFAKSEPVDKLDTKLKSLINRQNVALKNIKPLSEGIITEKGLVKVSVRLNTIDPSAIQSLREAGLNVTAGYHGLVSGTISSLSLLKLANINYVSTISLEMQPRTRSVISQAVAALRIENVTKAHPEITGKGQKIGIISDSFGLVSEATPVYDDIDNDGLIEIVGTDSQIKGELPAVVEIVKEATYEVKYDADGNPLPPPTHDEGRGMAEVIYDIAPGADLAFYAPGGKADFAQGILALANAGCNIIVDDLQFENEANYQDDEIALAIKQIAESSDVVYLTAAGNGGSMAFEQKYKDIDPKNDDGPMSKIPKGNDFNQWSRIGNQNSPFLPIILQPGDSTWINLYWENPYSGTLGAGATTDYDMYIYSSSDNNLGNIVTYSDNAQGTPESPMGDPVEFIYIENNEKDRILMYYLVINKHHGPDATFYVAFDFGGDVHVSPTVRMDACMNYGHTRSAYGLTVGAVNFKEILTGGDEFNTPARIDPEYFSSHGGIVSTLYSDEGTPLKKPSKVFKPDITSADGVNTSFFSRLSIIDGDKISNFFGTSCSAPDAAALVALMRQANPILNAKQIRDLARYAATDVCEPGVDYFAGYGLLYADKAVEAALNPPNPIPESIVDDWMLHLNDTTE